MVGELVRGGNAASRQQSLQDLDRFVRHPRSLASNVSVSAADALCLASFGAGLHPQHLCRHPERPELLIALRPLVLWKYFNTGFKTGHQRQAVMLCKFASPPCSAAQLQLCACLCCSAPNQLRSHLLHVLPRAIVSMVSGVQGFETLLGPEEGRFRIMRQSSLTLGGIKAVPDPLQLAASEESEAKRLRAQQTERQRLPRATWPLDGALG